MHSILRTSVRLDLPRTEGRGALHRTEIGMFVVEHRSGRAVGRATMRVDVCPITKTILGLEVSPDRLSTARPAAVATHERARKRKHARRNADAWPLPGMPRTVMVDCPEVEAPTFRDAFMKLGETGPSPEG